MKKNWKAIPVVAAVMTASVLSQTASADTPDTMEEWTREANVIVQSALLPSRLDSDVDKSSVVQFNVTVDRSGDLVSYVQKGKSEEQELNAVATNLVASTDYPALPESYKADQMTFSLALIYSADREGAVGAGAVLTTLKSQLGSVN
ncbi:TonB C-terminal domain-containing protein [Kordiimonas laminariae]|uniref:TonB C-terminal domain-containing protein n=1 Tax=Kordiimonas laminariae TaxID=2917717 RepID=UPI001FF6AF09|nr:TonB C-terminal domain-containing protein [Kordiimonas laminariae]MCK0070504.1 TonB C-terminal domain-containing protein [Kordiimonas laminariae]